MPRVSFFPVLICVAHLARLKQLNSKTGLGQARIQPLRQRPASKPILDSVTSCRENPAINASGSLATDTSRMIEPSASTTQTLDCSNETSMPQ